MVSPGLDRSFNSDSYVLQLSDTRKQNFQSHGRVMDIAGRLNKSLAPWDLHSGRNKDARHHQEKLHAMP